MLGGPHHPADVVLPRSAWHHCRGLRRQDMGSITIHGIHGSKIKACGINTNIMNHEPWNDSISKRRCNSSHRLVKCKDSNSERFVEIFKYFGLMGPGCPFLIVICYKIETSSRYQDNNMAKRQMCRSLPYNAQLASTSCTAAASSSWKYFTAAWQRGHCGCGGCAMLRAKSI